MAGVREPGARGGQPLSDQRLGRDRPERPRSHGRLGRARQQLRRAARAPPPARPRGPRTTPPIGSSSSERASNASHRSDGASAQCTSSTTRTAGPRSPRLLTSHTNPRAAACIASPAGAGPPPSGASARSASPAAPTVSSSHSGRVRSGSNSCRAIPHAACCSSGLQRAHNNVAPSTRAARPAAPSNVDLPMPAGPSTTITRPDPERAVAIRRPSSPNSASRSSNTPIGMNPTYRA